MENKIRKIGEKIVKQKYQIANEVHQQRLAQVDLPESMIQELKKIEKEIIEIRASFIQLFGEALVDHEDTNKAIEKINRWGKETGEYFFTLGTTLDEALKDTTFYRHNIWKIIQKEAEALDLPVSTIFDIKWIIDPLLDEAVYSFSLSYVNFHQSALENAKTAFLELSVPVVPLMPGVGVLPLIGNVDTERAQLLMEETLKQAVNLRLSDLIFDLSGVLVVDTMVADQLFKVINALSLIGVNTILSGIRPEVAQTMVALGIDFGNLTIKTNLHQAFQEIQTRSV